MTLTWAKENLPRWDADKQRLFGPAELASVGLPALYYIYNVVPDSHPDGPWIRRWLTDRGFQESPDGLLRRQTTHAAAGGDED